MNWLYWNDLTEEEREMATETYIYTRECEEGRERNDVISNPDYPDPIDPEVVQGCRFLRKENECIIVDI